MIYRSHKIRIYPNNRQRTFLLKSVGVSRFVYNWGLEEWRRQYEAGDKPNRFGLKVLFNSVKKEKFPFVCEVSKWVADYALLNLDLAFKNFFRRVKQKSAKPGYPKFKKKGSRDSFTIEGTAVKTIDSHLKLPKLSPLRMAESLRFSGKIVSATVSQKAGRWFASILVKLPDDARPRENQATSPIGVDLGVSKLATLSDGSVFESPRSLRKYEKRLRLLNKSLSRKVKNSSNWRKAKARLANLHYKIGRVRLDAMHKLTTFLAKTYSPICLEDLNVSGLLKNRRLSRALSDSSFHLFRQLLTYKATEVVVVDRFFPSSKLCMNCGTLHQMPLSKRIFECACGVGPVDRDVHAAQNLLRQGLLKK